MIVCASAVGVFVYHEGRQFSVLLDFMKETQFSY